MPGERVAVFTSNAFVSAVSMCAILRAGAVYAPINPNLTGAFLGHQLRLASASVIIVTAAFAEILAEAGVAAHVLTVEDDWIVNFRGSGETLKGQDRAQKKPGDAAALIFTSGTSGAAKGVLLPQRWINQYTFLARSILTEQDVVHCDLPLYHVGGAFSLVGRALWSGVEVVVWDKFSVNDYWARVARYRSTTAILIGVMISWIMRAPQSQADRSHSLSNVHMQPLPPNAMEVADRFGLDVLTCGFGQTETGAVAAGVFELGESVSGERRIAAEARLASATSLGVPVLKRATPVAAGIIGGLSPLYETCLDTVQSRAASSVARGELCLRPLFPDVALTAYVTETGTNVPFDERGFFHTGDVCEQTHDIGIRYLGRLGAFFRVRGENVSASEVEDTLKSYQGVREAVAFAVSADEGFEDEIVAYVEPNDPTIDLSVEGLLDHCRSRMPKYMLPSHLRISSALPLTPTGKVAISTLRDQFLSEISS